MNFKFELLENKKVGIIELGNKVRVSDPCYSLDTWCAGTLENVLEGKYNCYSQKVDTGDWGVRIASIEVKHENYLHIEPTELTSIDVGVDSGQAGIYDLDYFARNREDKDGEDAWYQRVCNETYKYVKNPNHVRFKDSEFWKDEYYIYTNFKNGSGLDDLDRLIITTKQIRNEELTEKEKQYVEQEEEFKEIEDDYYKSYMKYYEKYKNVHSYIGMFTASVLDNKCLVSSSGDGDGGYHCLVGRNDEGKIVSIKIDYYYKYEEDDEEDDLN